MPSLVYLPEFPSARNDDDLPEFPDLPVVHPHFLCIKIKMADADADANSNVNVKARPRIQISIRKEASTSLSRKTHARRSKDIHNPS